MNRYSVLLSALAASSIFSGCPRAISITPGGGPPAPTLQVRTDPAVIALQAGSSTSINVEVTRLGGKAAAVEIAVTGLPAGVTAPRVEIGANETTGVLVLTAAAGAGAGASAAVLHSASGGEVRALTLLLIRVAANAAEVESLLPDSPRVQVGEPAVLTAVFSGEGALVRDPEVGVRFAQVYE